MRRKAVAIGLNRYQSVSGLRGCVNDVTNVGLVFENRLGFGADEIRVISDDAATKSEIEAHIDWLVDGAASGDLLVLHFSGHGSQIRDDDGDELVDGKDEILCPYDMAWGGTYITDDQLRSRLVVPQGVVLEVILDACHTGSADTELAAPAASELGDPDRQPRFLEPPATAAASAGTRSRLFRRAMEPEIVLWSACGSAQTAADARINDIFNGAFTFYFCKHLRESAGNVSREELLLRVRNSLAAGGFSQVPELAAPLHLRTKKPFQR